MAENMRMIDGKKFMWDGVIYEERSKAEETQSQYQENKFETRLLTEEGKYLIYTRRVAEQQTPEE